ncbi:MAG: AAA family ATPase [Elusimicrobia bacterium]|nr:AAA family ATPase [Elusimicrobiota bacterium]
MILRIERRDVERELADCRQAVIGSGLGRLLAEVDPGDFGTTALNLGMLDAVSQALATAAALLRLPQAEGLGRMAAGQLFVEEAADRLAALGAAGEPPETAGLALRDYQELAQAGAREALDFLLKDAASFARFYQRHPDAGRRLKRDAEALRCMGSYFRLAGRLLCRLYPPAPDAEVETPRLRLRGGKASAVRLEEPSALLPVTFDDVVGNAELVKSGSRLARDVAGFDLKAGENPKKIRNQILFVLGTPGCGKTVTAHAVGNYFLDLCRKSSIPSRVRVIRRTDWASSYQNQSASRLLEIFQEEVFRFDGVCGVYWPDIDTAFAARGDSDIRQEEKANLGTIFGILDGTIGPKNGKWFMVCDANTLHMDEATLSRLSQAPITAKGPVTPEDYVKLLRDVKLRGKGPWLKVAEDEWARIGARCLKERLSGRSVDNLAGRVLTEIEDFTEPPEYFTADLEAKRKMIAELSRSVGAARVMDLISEHCRFERDAQAKEAEEKFRGRVAEIRFHLSAQRAALMRDVVREDPPGAGGLPEGPSGGASS